MRIKGLFIVFLIFVVQGCSIKKPLHKQQKHAEPTSFSKTLHYTIENQTTKKIYVCCFFYAKGNLDGRWSWHKSGVMSIEPQQKGVLEVPVITNTKNNMEDIQGYLSVFNNKEEADMAVMELLDDDKRIDLGTLINLDNKNIRVVAERYGIKGEHFDYNLPRPDKNQVEEKVPESVFFSIENKIGKEIYLTGFVYEHLHSHPQWDFEKLPVVLVPQNHTAKITIPLGVYQYDWENMYGYIATFDKEQKEEAENCTYESLSSENKIKLGALRKIMNHTITLEPKMYGVLTGFDDAHPDIEFIIKPPRKINEYLQRKETI